MQTCEILSIKKAIYSLLASVIFIGFIPNTSGAAKAISADGEIESGEVICTSDVYLDDPGDCH